MSERTVAIVGRPNVGKSALFNRLAGKKISIVHDRPGVTRDRIAASCKLGNFPFTLLDTGGIGTKVDAEFTRQVHAEVDLAMDAAEVLLFVVDAQSGLTPLDRDLAGKLRRIGKPVLLVINKVDVDQHAPHAAEFSQLGFTDQMAISAEHNRGILPLVAWIERLLPSSEPQTDPETEPETPVKIAIVGRPNVGKSSLTNAFLEDQRTLVSDIAGTTRDAIDIPYRRHGNPYLLIDTAGIRSRSKVSDSVEVFSVMRSETSIKRADLCLLVLDATAGVTAQDKKIAGLIHAARKPCVVTINKWDLVREHTQDKESLSAFLDHIRAQLFFLDYAPVLLASAKTGAEMTRIFKTIERVHRESQTRIATGPLNRLFAEAIARHPAPIQSGRRFKLLYATQAETRTRSPIPIPELVLFCNDEKLLPENYRKYLDAQIRAAHPFTGIPILFHLRARDPKTPGSGGSRGKKPAGGPAPRSRRRPEKGSDA